MQQNTVFSFFFTFANLIKENANSNIALQVCGSSFRRVHSETLARKTSFFLYIRLLFFFVPLSVCACVAFTQELDARFSSYIFPNVECKNRFKQYIAAFLFWLPLPTRPGQIFFLLCIHIVGNNFVHKTYKTQHLWFYNMVEIPTVLYAHHWTSVVEN